MIINEGLNKIRDSVYADLYDGQAGTSTTAATRNDSGLGGPIGTSIKALESKTTGDKVINVTYYVPSTVGTSTITEAEIRFTDGRSLNHIVHSGIAMTSTKEIYYLTGLLFESE